MWVCNECGEEFGFPKWDMVEVEKYQSFTEVPYCPFCSSFDIEEIMEDE